MTFRRFDDGAGSAERGTNVMSKRSIVLTGIIITAAMARLVPHPPNVTPIGAIH
jgi:hypothetical protein